MNAEKFTMLQNDKLFVISLLLCICRQRGITWAIWDEPDQHIFKDSCRCWTSFLQDARMHMGMGLQKVIRKDFGAWTTDLRLGSLV